MSVLDLKTIRGPGDKTADDVGCVLVPELVQPHGSEARGVALVADEDEVVFVSGKGRALVSRGRIDAPLEDAERDVHRAGDAAIPSANIAVTRVDEDPSGAHRGRGLRRRQSAQPGARRGKHLIDPALRDARMLSQRRTS